MRVLIVDDEEGVVAFLSQAARARGAADIDTAFSGEEALGLIIQKSYDLITLDIRMPGLSGLEILSPLRNMCPHAIIAIISGHIPEDLSEDLAGCADLVIHKPVKLKTLNGILDGAFRISQTMEAIQELGD